MTYTWWGRILSQPCPECRAGVLSYHVYSSPGLYLVFQNLFTPHSWLQKTFLQVCSDRSPTRRRKILFCPKPQLSFKLSPVSPPAMDLTYAVTSYIYPRRTGFISGKSRHLVSWEQMVWMTHHALFSWMGMKCTRCTARWCTRSPNPGVHLTSRQKHCDFSRAGLSWSPGTWLQNSFSPSEEPRNVWI